jgi:signal transduction histidine kinase
MVEDITEQRAAQNTLINYQKQLKSLTTELMLAEQKERQQFADFLHDEIGQQLFAARLQLEQLKDSISSAENTKTLNNALNILYQVMNQSRTLTTELSSPILKQLGLEKALEWLAEETYKKYDIMVTFEDDRQEKPLGDNMKILLYQSVSELLTNVAKHAQTKNASVSIKKYNSSVRICVEDNGVGFYPPTDKSSHAMIGGIGLFRIKERLEPLDGQLEIESQQNRGTKITLVVPLDDNFQE